MKFFRLLVLAFFLFSCSGDSGDDSAVIPNPENTPAPEGSPENTFQTEGCSGFSRPLIAGQTDIIGSIDVVESDGIYTITYEITNELWCIDQWFLDVRNSPEAFPVDPSGNPDLNRFRYKDQGACQKIIEVEVPVSQGPWVAAHAVVTDLSSSLDNIDTAQTVDFCTGSSFGPEAYLTITTSSGPVSGVFPAWCVDQDRSISTDECLEDIPLYISQVSFPSDLFEQPGNINAVNWLLNEELVGKDSPTGLGKYTYGDMQAAIWKLLDDDPICESCGLGTWTEDRAEELQVRALLQGEGFIPECGDLAGIILEPEARQPLMIPVLIECPNSSIDAWGDGCNFPGSRWALYFRLD